MYREIELAIFNIYGYRPVYCEPYMVLEILVKKQIERLKKPVLECIDSVVKELASAVRLCTQPVSDFTISIFQKDKNDGQKR